MKTFLVKIVCLAVLLGCFQESLAKGTRRDPMTLYDYIDVKCSTKCVEAYQALDAARRASEEISIDVYVLLAIMRVESAYTVSAKNASNVGLMQINLRYHKPKFPNTRYLDVRENVRVGAIVYRDCLKRSKGRTDKALSCYNGNADPLYVQKVNKSIKELRALAVLL